MLSSIHHLSRQICSLVNNLHEKRGIVHNKISYVRALQLFSITLQKAFHDLEDIYYHYVLRKQILHDPVVISCVYCMHIMSSKKHQDTNSANRESHVPLCPSS